MNTIFKWAFVLGAIYFGVNWAADNPKTMDEIRVKMNQAVQDGTEWLKKNTRKVADEAINSAKEST